MKHFILNSQINLKTNLQENITEPEITYVHNFNDDDLTKFRTSIDLAIKNKQPYIVVVISSTGGNVYNALAMGDMLHNTKMPIATVCLGKSLSAGGLLLTYGTEGNRYISHNSMVMLHDAAWGYIGDAVTFHDRAEMFAKQNKLLYNIMSVNCGHHKDYFYNLLHQNDTREFWADAELAKQHNLINHIGIPKFTTEVEVKVKFGL